jgi:hypothetical protein
MILVRNLQLQYLLKLAGDYDIVVTNTVTGASGTFVNGISYNGIPTWTTAAGSLGTFESETTYQYNNIASYRT